MEQRKKTSKSNRYESSGSVIRYLRICAGLSQQKLADRCEGKLCPNDISKIERGDFGVRTYKILAVAAFFGITLDSIAHNDFCAIGDAVSTETAEISERRRRKKKQYRKSQSKKDAAGELGQKLVIEWEREKLRGSGLEALVRDCIADDESAGFDVFSFSESGSPLFIEVKSAIGDADQFFMTENERCFAEYCLKNGLPYRLYSIKNVFEKKKRSFRIYTAEELLGCMFIINEYIVKERSR